MLSILSRILSIFYTTDPTALEDVVENDTIVNGIDITISTDKSDDLIFVESTSLKTYNVYINDDYINGKIDKKNNNVTNNNITKKCGNNSLDIVNDIEKSDNEPKIDYHEKVKKDKEYILKTMYKLQKKKEEGCDKALIKKEEEGCDKALIKKKEEGCDKALIKKVKKRGKKRKRNGGKAKNKKQKRKKNRK